MPDQANLLFVFGDEWRGQSVGYIGNPDVRTPHLDRLAAEGCAFEHCYANVPVCTPSRGTMLTGLYPLSHGAVSNDLPIHHDGVPSIARALGESGYRRAYIGKWHLGGIPRYRFIPPDSERLGFDDYWAVWNCHHTYTDPKYFLDEPEPVFAQGYEPTVQTDLALQFLDDHLSQHRTSPFCLYLSWGPPHAPYRPLPPGTEGMYDDPAALTLRPNVGDISQHRSDWQAYFERVAGPDTEWARVLAAMGQDPTTGRAQRKQDMAAFRQDLADYYAHITALDAEVGRLLAYLEEAGILENTLVVFTSDHGTMLGSHGHVNKQLPWEEAINVPLLMRYPQKMQPGSRSDLMVGLVDLTPTLLGLLDIGAPRGFEGYDLSRHIGGNDRSRAPEMVFLMEHICCDQAISSGIDVWRGLRTPRYTYARDINGPWLLYDNLEDPNQQRNLIASPDHAEVRAHLNGALIAWLQERRDPFLDAEGMLDVLGLRLAWRARNESLYSGREMSGDWPDRAR